MPFVITPLCCGLLTWKLHFGSLYLSHENHQTQHTYAPANDPRVFTHIWRLHSVTAPSWAEKLKKNRFQKNETDRRQQTAPRFATHYSFYIICNWSVLLLLIVCCLYIFLTFFLLLFSCWALYNIFVIAMTYSLWSFFFFYHYWL